MLLPRGSSQTPKQLRMKILKIKVCEQFLGTFWVTTFRQRSIQHMSTFILSLVDVLLLIKKRPPPTLPKMVDVGSEEKVGTVSYWLSFEPIIFYFVYFLVQTFLEWSPLLVVYVVCWNFSRRSKTTKLQTKMRFWKQLPTWRRATRTAL